MISTPRHPALRLTAAPMILLLALTACTAEEAESASRNGDAAEDHYPVTVENCGYEVELGAAPERIALMETAPVTILDGLGAFDRVVIRAGDFPEEYYDDALHSRIEGVTSLSEELDASGHLTLSQEEIIAHEPDLMLGLPEGATREGLADGGAEVLEQEIYCPEFDEDASFSHVYDEIGRYGKIFALEDEAQAMVESLSARVEEAGRGAEAEDRTAAVLYPSVGGGPVYAYGRASMAHPQLETLGFENVFAESTERVFEVQAEELVGRDPDILILLYQGDPDGVEDAVRSLPGAETMTAVQEGAVLTHLFNFTEPATPLSVDGLELIAEHFQEGRP